MGNKKFFKRPTGTSTATGLVITNTNTQSGTNVLTHNLTGVPAGALLVITTACQSAQTNATINSAPALTFTKRADATSPLSPGAEIYTAVFAAGGSISITSNWGAGIVQTSVCYTITGQEAVLGGNSATAVNQSTAGISIVTSKINSKVFCVSSNWNAPLTPLTYIGTPIKTLEFRDPVNLTAPHYYYNFATVAGQTVGYSFPTDVDQGTSTAVLEIRSGTGGTSDTSSPSAPILNSPNRTDTTIILQWTASTDPESGIAQYDIYNGTTLLGSTGALTYTVTGLTQNTTYNLKVRAINTVSLFTDSNIVSVTTSITPPTTTTTTTTSVGPTTTTTTTTLIPNNPFTFTALTTDYPRYWGGSERWNENSRDSCQSVPGIAGTMTPLVTMHYYRRFSWNDIEGTTQGSYNWAKFDSKVQDAVNNKQLFSFGIMTVFTEIGQAGGFNSWQTYSGIDQKTGSNKTADSAYPQYVHNLMQGEATKDWVSGTDWIPNFNSVNYRNRLGALYAAIVSHLASTTYSGHLGTNVVGYVDLRGMGNYGEWHSNGIINTSVSEYPAGTFPSAASLIGIVDAHRTNITLWPLTTILNSLDGNFDSGNGFQNTKIPASVGQYIMDNGNAWGDIGWRRDQWGDINDYYRVVIQTGTTISKISTRWQTAPVVGEPPGYNNSDTQVGGTHMAALNLASGQNGTQVASQHATMIGNGNYGCPRNPECGPANSNNCDSNDCNDCNPCCIAGTSTGDAMRTAFKNMGCILRLNTGGGTTLTATTFQITTLWQNYGVGPQFKKNWQTTFELRGGGGTLVWSAVSTFNSFLLRADQGQQTHTDNFGRPAVAAGNYQLSVRIVDANGYCDPFQLGIQGRQANGSYILSNITL